VKICFGCRGVIELMDRLKLLAVDGELHDLLPPLCVRYVVSTLVDTLRTRPGFLPWGAVQPSASQTGDHTKQWCAATLRETTSIGTCLICLREVSHEMHQRLRAADTMRQSRLLLGGNALEKCLSEQQIGEH
jgi:hypothetical protein